MASVTSTASDKTNGKPPSKEPEKPNIVAQPDVEEEEEDEEDEDDEEEEFEEVEDEDERQMVDDDEDEDEDQDEEGEEQDGQNKPQSLTHFLLNDPEEPEDNQDEIDENETEDVYIPPAPEPISRKRSHHEVAEDEEEPDSKKAKA